MASVRKEYVRMPDNADAIQPEQGQGGDASGAPYQEYLDRIPAEVRGDVEPVFREWDANTTRRFQESAEYRKQWEPYEQLGVNQVDPQELQWLMQFRDALQDPASIQAWYEQYAQQNNLYGNDENAQFDQEQGQQFIDPNVQEIVEQQLQQHLGPLAGQLQDLAGWREQQEQQVAQSAALEYVEGQVQELQKKHGSEFDMDMVEKLVANYIETDPEHAVEKAFQDSLHIRSQIEKAVLQSKVEQPAAAESGGAPDTHPPNVDGLKQAGELARERLRAARLQ